MQTLSTPSMLTGFLSTNKGLNGVISKSIKYRDYLGPYEVEPEQYEQVLPTANKLLNKNVIVKEISLCLATTSQIDELF